MITVQTPEIFQWLSRFLVPMETKFSTLSSTQLEYWMLGPFVHDEISSATFQQQTSVLPPDSLLIEMQINLRGWLHFPQSFWQVQLYPESADVPTSDFSCLYLKTAAKLPLSLWRSICFRNTHSLNSSRHNYPSLHCSLFVHCAEEPQ